VGSRRARIRLGDESVDVELDAEELRVMAPGGEVDGAGETDRQTVLDLLDGYLEVGDAILDGRLRVEGDVDAIGRMFTAIEILLDASARDPALQQLARDFRNDPGLEPPGRPTPGSREEPWYPSGVGPLEAALLERLDLLP
jgi:hypothetical protein